MRLLSPLIAVAMFLWTATAGAQTEIAYGWSVHASEAQAAAEAGSMLKKGLTRAPNFVILLATSGYSSPKVLLDEVREELGNPKLFGFTSYRGVFTPDGVHVGEKGASLAILGFATSDYAIGAGVGRLAREDLFDMGLLRDANPEAVAKATREAIAAARAQAGQAEDATPALILLSSQPGTEELVLDEVKRVFGDKVPLFGGSSNKNDFTFGPVFANDRVSEKGLAIALFFGKKTAGTHFHAGFAVTKRHGKVTRMAGPRVVAEIDGRPAFDVLNGWSGGALNHVDVSTSPVILRETSTHCFARRLDAAKGIDRIVSVVPTVARPDKSLEVGASFKVGDEIFYVEGTTRTLVERPSYVTTLAARNARIAEEAIAGALHTYCTAASWAVGEEEIQGIVPEITKALGGRPFIGAFSGGEQGLMPGKGYFQGNLMSSTVVFSK